MGKQCLPSQGTSHGCCVNTPEAPAHGGSAATVAIFAIEGLEEGRRLSQGLQLTPQEAPDYAPRISKEEAPVRDFKGFGSGEGGANATLENMKSYQHTVAESKLTPEDHRTRDQDPNL